MFDDKGTSLIFVNSDKGQDVFDGIIKNIKYAQVDINEAVKYNTSAYSAVYKPIRRKRYMQRIGKEDFENITKKYKKLSIEDKVILKLKALCRHIK